ncbi:hypothetical protein HN51_044146 [Arachis hypogaea]
MQLCKIRKTVRDTYSSFTRNTLKNAKTEISKIKLFDTGPIKISWIGIARVAITAPASKERGSDRGQSSSQIPTQRMAAPPCPSLLGAEPPATTSKGGRRVAPPPPPHWKKEELFGEGSNSRGGSAQIRSSSVRVYWFRVS